MTDIELEDPTAKPKSTRKRSSKYPDLLTVQNQYTQSNCQDCTLCELSESRNLVVWARGQNHKNLTVIGEAPGKTEDHYGLPFVGESGKLLQNMFKSVGLNPELDCYITNIVKCRPPDNRVPNVKEANSCFGYLVNQLIESQPKLILAMGGTAGKFLTDEKQFSVTKARGKHFPIGDKFQQFGFKVEVFITLHPSALLREQTPKLDPGSNRWLVWNDLKAMRQMLDSL